MQSISKFFILLLSAALTGAALLSGCGANAETNPPAETALAPAAANPDITGAATAYPLDFALEGAPGAGGELATVYPPSEGAADTAYPAPAEGGEAPPAAAPVIENRSRVTAQLLEQTPVSGDSGLIRLRVLVTATQEIEGMPSFTAGLEAQETDLFIPVQQMIDIETGASFSAEVTYRGDEHGGKLYVTLLLP